MSGRRVSAVRVFVR